MAKTKRLSLQERIEKEAIEKLVVKGFSVAELADTLGQNYYTVRKTIKNLEAMGLVRGKASRGNTIIYSLVEPDAKQPNNSIPVGKGTKGPIKLTALLHLTGNEKDSVAAKAAVDLPRNMARILMAALRNVESGGTYDIDKNMRAIRLELSNNLKALENVVSLHKTILDSDIFWDPMKIKAVPFDVDFDKSKVIETYRHYYPED